MRHTFCTHRAKWSGGWNEESGFVSGQGNGWLLNNISHQVNTNHSTGGKPFPFLVWLLWKIARKEREKEGKKRERERKEGGREGGGRKKEIGRKERRRKEKRDKGRKEGEREKRKKKEVGKDVEKSEPPMHSWLLAGLQCRPWKSRREAIPLPRGLHGTSATSRGQVLSPSSHNGQAILQWVETILRNS